MSHENLRKLVQSALFAALCTAMTLVIQVPSPVSGYVNLGDCGVLLSAWVLGPWYGGAAAGIGSMLADIFSGYAHYAPGTLAIKLAMAVLAGLLVQKHPRKTAARLLGGVGAECVMVAGYFGYASLLLGRGLGAAASIPGNLVQGVFSLAAALALISALERSKALSRLYWERAFFYFSTTFSFPRRSCKSSSRAGWI